MIFVVPHIPKEANIILNPIHDYMLRPEMKLKREYLSRSERWVISVWNKGKKSEASLTASQSFSPRMSWLELRSMGIAVVVLTSATIRRRRMVAIEFGMWRSGRKGGASGSVTVGYGRLREQRGGTRC